MKSFATIILAAMTSLIAQAQTLNIQMGEVTYQIPASQAGDMTFANGETLTAIGKAYDLSKVDQMYVDDSQVTNTTVSVAYNGTTADVKVAGNIARFLTVEANGSNVTIVQSDGLQQEITYTLSGTSTAGSFYMDGSFKATLVLNGLTLHNPDSAAINIRNGKRINVQLADGTVNTLTDGTGGTQKACFAVKGHTEFKGGGTLNITGNSAHAFWGKEYVQLKKTVGNINILGAVGDGFNVNQYYQQNGGNVTIKNVGDDGIQVSYKTDDDDVILTLEQDEDNTGLLTVNGGIINATVTGTAGKALKSEGKVVVNGGSLTLKAAGEIDLTDTTDPSYTAGIKGAAFDITDGSIDITVTGTAGRGISADSLSTHGGIIKVTNSGAGNITTTGSSWSSTSEYYTAKGLKGDYMTLAAGDITINMSGTGGKGILCGSETKVSNAYTGSFSMGLADGTGPTLSVTTTGSMLSSGSSSGGGGGQPGGPGGGGGPGQETEGSSAKAIKIWPAATIYGGETTVSTATDGAEGLESKTKIDIQGGNHYFKCYDDCMNSAGQILFNGGVCVCYSYGNDAVDSNYGKSGAITIGNGAVFSYSTKGDPEEGFDCDNNSYIQITGTGIGISTGGKQGGSSSSSTISGAVQGYYFYTSKVSYAANTYYTLSDASGNNLVTFKFDAACASNLALLTAKGMVKNSTYYVKSNTLEPTDATTAFHGLYIGSTAVGKTSVFSFTAK